ncbi:MAG: GYD domain-containing protein [Thermomicrobiales bacterium]
MATFVLLSTLTDEGAKTIRHDPGRIQEVNAEIERLGVKVLSQWAVLGPYDFVNVVEATDNLAIARVSAELASRGTIRITSMPAIPIEEFIGGLGASS